MGILYRAANEAMETTAGPVPVTTGTAVKTLLQIATPSTTQIKVVEWGITFDGAPSAIKAELIQTDVAATVVAHVAAGVQPYDDSGAPPSLMTLGTTATGYTASGEGTPAASRMGDFQLLSTNNYVKQWPLGREFKVPISKFLRVRVTAAAGAVNAYCWVIWEE